MAKAKTSQQDNLSLSRTGIDMTEGLGFGKKINVDNLVEDKKVDNLVESSSKSETEHVVDTYNNHESVLSNIKPSTKLKRPESLNNDDTTYKISALISPKAKDNLEKYAKLYGYKKLSPFINDLFERLDAYMD